MNFVHIVRVIYEWIPRYKKQLILPPQTQREKASKPALLYLHQNHAEKDFGTLQYTIVHTLVKTAPLKILQPTVSSQ